MSKIYKGFNKDLQCKSTQYKMGCFTMKVNEKDVTLDEGTTIVKQDQIDFKSHSDGFHSCENLYYIPHEYRKKDSIICEVEIAGNWQEFDGKYISTAIKPIKQLSKEEIQNLLLKQAIKDGQDNLKLDIVRILQDSLVGCHIGGSLGLYLGGYTHPNRIGTDKSDIDIVLPYYQPLPEIDGYTKHTLNIKNSGNDFDYGVEYKGSGDRYIKIDIKIDPYQTYEVVTYEDGSYNISSPLKILEAKIKYALLGNDKHETDIKNMIKSKDANLSIDSEKLYNKFFGATNKGKNLLF